LEPGGIDWGALAYDDQAAPAQATTHIRTREGDVIWPIPADFDWTPKSTLAATMLAEGCWTRAQVALAAGVTANTIWNWMHKPAFAKAVEQVKQRYWEEAADIGMQRKTERARRLADRLDRIHRVIEERAAAGSSRAESQAYGIDFDEDLAAAPGGGSGIVVHQKRQIGTGKNAEIIDEYVVDTATLHTEAALSKQLAQEIGQWTEKSESTVIKKLYIGIDLDDM